MAQIPIAHGGMPGWVTMNQPTQAPSWLVAWMPVQATMWWRGILSLLEPLLARCSALPAPHLDNFVNGTNIAAHPTQPHLFTQCLVPTGYRATLGRFSNRFRFVPKGKGSKRGAKAGCFKLRASGCGLEGGQPLPPQEIYISRLLCYMYRGPPPPLAFEACHLCENRMCLAPWHLVWDSHQQNIKGYFVHKKDRREYHPYGQAEAPAGH